MSLHKSTQLDPRTAIDTKKEIPGTLIEFPGRAPGV